LPKPSRACSRISASLNARCSTGGHLR
jgi:hypothetical protein